MGEITIRDLLIYYFFIYLSSCFTAARFLIGGNWNSEILDIFFVVAFLFLFFPRRRFLMEGDNE